MAKAMGIKRGMQVSEARKICPNIIIRVARPDIYVDIHNKIVAEVNRHVPVKKVWSIDEVECELIGRERHLAYDIGRAIQDGLKQNIGPYITPSIGLAPNQFLAKVAAEMDKPNGFVMLRMDDLPGPLFGLKLSDLPGISRGMETRLHKAGVMTVEDFWNISPKHARAIWGNLEGERLWAQLHGHAIEKPPTQRRMFGHSRVLSGEFKDPKRIASAVKIIPLPLCRSLLKSKIRVKPKIKTVGRVTHSFPHAAMIIAYSPICTGYMIAAWQRRSQGVCEVPLSCSTKLPFQRSADGIYSKIKTAGIGKNSPMSWTVLTAKKKGRSSTSAPAPKSRAVMPGLRLPLAAYQMQKIFIRGKIKGLLESAYSDNDLFSVLISSIMTE